MRPRHFWWLRHHDGFVLEVSTTGHGQLERRSAGRVVDSLEAQRGAALQPEFEGAFGFRVPDGWVVRWSMRLDRVQWFATRYAPLGADASAVAVDFSDEVWHSTEPRDEPDPIARCEPAVAVPAVCESLWPNRRTERSFVLLQPCGPGADEALFAIAASLRAEICRFEVPETGDDASLLWVVAATGLALARSRRR